jgi:hypothetical protein
MGRARSAADGRPALKDPSPCPLVSPSSLHGFTLGPSVFLLTQALEKRAGELKHKEARRLLCCCARPPTTLEQSHTPGRRQ